MSESSGSASCQLSAQRLEGPVPRPDEIFPKIEKVEVEIRSPSSHSYRTLQMLEPNGGT